MVHSLMEHGVICGWAWKRASADLVAQTLQRLVISGAGRGEMGGGVVSFSDHFSHEKMVCEIWSRKKTWGGGGGGGGGGASSDL